MTAELAEPAVPVTVLAAEPEPDDPAADAGPDREAELPAEVACPAEEPEAALLPDPLPGPEDLLTRSLWRLAPADVCDDPLCEAAAGAATV